MTDRRLKDHGASIRQRLLNHAKEHGDDFQRILTRYAIERLLYRLSRTEAAETYILKGAMLYLTWPEHVFRPTGDLDLLGHGDSDPAAISELFTHICQIDEPTDGIVFDPAPLQAEPIREEDKYQGVRLTLKGVLAKAVITFHVDIGFGDHVYPPPSRAEFPSLLSDLPPANVLMYPTETVVAEKFEAMIRFGEANTRIKDFYDIWVTTRTFPFDLAKIVEAVAGTLRRRETAVPTKTPVALMPQFAELPEKQRLWTAFLRRNPPTLPPPPFGDMLAELRRFLEPVLDTLALPESAKGRWNHDRGAWE